MGKRAAFWSSIAAATARQAAFPPQLQEDQMNGRGLPPGTWASGAFGAFTAKQVKLCDPGGWSEAPNARSALDCEGGSALSYGH